MNVFELFKNGLSSSRNHWSAFHQKMIADWKCLVRPENLLLRPDGMATVSLQVSTREVMNEMRKFGTFVSCTGNAHSMLCHPLRYPEFKECRCKGRAIDPTGKMAVLLDDSITVSASQESIGGVPTLGLEFRDQQRELKHRCILQPDADWGRFVRKISEWQPGGVRGLRLDAAQKLGRWDGRDQSAMVWVEEGAHKKRIPVRSWLMDYRERRRGFLESNDLRSERICAEEIYSLVSSASIEHRRLGITVPNEHFVESLSIVPGEVQWRSGTVRLESGEVQFQFSLTDLVEFFRVDLSDSNVTGTGYEAYDLNGDLALAFYDTRRF